MATTTPQESGENTATAPASTTQASVASETPRRGRPVDVALGRRILDHTLQQLAAAGYSNLEIESIAAAASCSKTTIYRRWGSKGKLVAAAIASEYPGSTVIDNGNLLDDILQHVTEGPSLLTFGRLPAVAWTAMLDPEVSAALREAVLNERDGVADEFIARAIERGELPADADGRTIVHTALGLGLYRRYVSDNEPLPPETLRQVLTALIASPPRVVQPGK
ncbi:MAG: TetR/AcrR family transcriptional regulator [Microterricola sp.]